jgi:hypothetical protein
LIGNCFLPISVGQPVYKIKGMFAGSIITETRPENNRKPITEPFRQEPVAVTRVWTGQEDESGEKPAGGGRTGSVSVPPMAYEAIITGSCS